MLDSIDAGTELLYKPSDVPRLHYCFAAIQTLNEKLMGTRISAGIGSGCPCCQKLALEVPPTKDQEAKEASGELIDACRAFDACLRGVCSDHLIDKARTCRLWQALITEGKYYNLSMLFNLLWSARFCPATHDACHKRHTFDEGTKKARSNTDANATWFLTLQPEACFRKDTPGIETIGGPATLYNYGAHLGRSSGGDKLSAIVLEEAGAIQSNENTLT